METKTIKLINHNLQAEFYIQISGEVAERLIAKGKESGFWKSLYYFYIDSCNSWIWKTEPALRKYLMSYRVLMNTTRREPDGNGEYLEWIEEVVRGTTGMFNGNYAVSEGTVQEIVT